MILFGPRFKSARLHKICFTFFLFFSHKSSNSWRDKSLIFIFLLLKSDSIFINLLENLEYKTFDKDGNGYLLKAKYGETLIDEQNTLLLKKVCQQGCYIKGRKSSKKLKNIYQIKKHSIAKYMDYIKGNDNKTVDEKFKKWIDEYIKIIKKG